MRPLLLALLACAPFEGTVTLQTTGLGPGGTTVKVCDITQHLSGVPWTGECPDCEFAFEMRPGLVVGDDNPDCAWNPDQLWRDDEDGGPFLFGHSRNLFTSGEYANYSLGPQVLTGRAVDDEAAYWRTANGTLEFEGSRFVYEEDVSVSCALTEAEEGGPFGGDTALGDLPVDGWSRDVWEFTDRVGGTLRISVDTVELETACGLEMEVRQIDGCLHEVNLGTFTCAVLTEDGLCAGLTFDHAVPARYEVVVSSRAACTRARAGYVLQVEVPDGNADLALTFDDVEDVPSHESFSRGTLTVKGRMD